MPRLEIESLLRWVYRDELPKRQDEASLAPINSSWMIERINGGQPNYETHHYPIAAGPPHVDALRIDHAVRTAFVRSHVVLDWASARDLLMGDLASYLPAAPTIVQAGFNALALVLLHAQCGSRPPWDVGPIVTRPVGGKQPKIFWCSPDGTPTTPGTKRAGYYSPGACCKLQHVPSLAHVAEARAEYFVWWRALERIANVVSTLELDEYDAAPARAAPMPWLTGETDKRVIHEEKSAPSPIGNHADIRRLFPRRPSTSIGPPKKSALFSPVRIIKS